MYSWLVPITMLRFTHCNSLQPLEPSSLVAILHTDWFLHVLQFYALFIATHPSRENRAVWWPFYMYTLIGSYHNSMLYSLQLTPTARTKQPSRYSTHWLVPITILRFIHCYSPQPLVLSNLVAILHTDWFPVQWLNHLNVCRLLPRHKAEKDNKLMKL